MRMGVIKKEFGEYSRVAGRAQNTHYPMFSDFAATTTQPYDMLGGWTNKTTLLPCSGNDK